jgi:hypothetical protein
MSGQRNHYEKAFSGLLVRHGVKAIAVEQPRRPVLNGIQLKNLDFLVNGTDRVWGFDLKGRRDRPWITRADLFSLMGWRRLLPPDVEAALLFAFFEPGGETLPRLNDLPAMRHETPAGAYHFCLLGLQDTQRLARPRSARWGTFGFQWGAFCKHAQPLDSVLPAVAVAGVA